MKKVIALILLANLLFGSCNSAKEALSNLPEKTNRTYTDKKDKPQLIGYTTRARLQQSPFDEWFNQFYEQYKVDKTILNSVNHKHKDLEITIFMATWCRDSRREVPRFLKIMDYLKIQENQIKIVNFYLDDPQYKQSPDHEELDLNIHRVPTFVFYKKGIEIGRIVESPMNILETDIAQILLGVPSKPKYRLVTGLNKLIKSKGLTYLETNKTKLARQTRYTVKNSSELNSYGYFLLRTNRKKEAIAIFELNTLAFPKDSNVFDSLAEGYIAIENTELAIKNYQKVLEIDAENKQAKKMIAELEKKN